MTPSQLLRTAKPPEEEPPASPVATSGDVTVPKYTSDAIEEDFSIGVDLLVNTPRFLLFLQDFDDFHDVLGDKARKDLDAHIVAVQQFAGQWQNDEEVF